MTAELRAFERPERIAETIEAYRHYLGEAAALLDDPDITDLYRNPHEPVIWAVSAKTGKFQTPFQQSTERAEAFLGVVVAAFGTEFNARCPQITAVLPYHGARLTAARTPVVDGVFWVLRKPNDRVFTLEDYLEAGIIPHPRHVAQIRTLIAERANLLIAGPQACGKTTLLNTILAETARAFKGRERFVIIEDTDELRCPDPDHIKMMVGPTAGWDELIAFALRTTSTRFVIGELRHGARSLLEALQTGHPGYGTIHGSTPSEVMRRFESLLLKENAAIDRQEIAATINALIIIRRIGVGRIVRDILRVVEPSTDGYIFAPVAF